LFFNSNFISLTNQSQSDKSSVVSDLSQTKTQPLDLLGGNPSPAGDANADFADFNPRQFEPDSKSSCFSVFGLTPAFSDIIHISALMDSWN